MPVVLMSLLRFVVALVQMAGLLAYFHLHLGWGLLPTALVALLMAMMVPIAATIFGFMGAIYAWAWPWWLAALVFLPGLVLALTAIAGVGILGVLSAFFMKNRRRPHRPEASPSQASPGEVIEGEVISSHTDELR